MTTIHNRAQSLCLIFRNDRRITRVATAIRHLKRRGELRRIVAQAAEIPTPHCRRIKGREWMDTGRFSSRPGCTAFDLGQKRLLSAQLVHYVRGQSLATILECVVGAHDGGDAHDKICRAGLDGLVEEIEATLGLPQHGWGAGAGLYFSLCNDVRTLFSAAWGDRFSA